MYDEKDGVLDSVLPNFFFVVPVEVANILRLPRPKELDPREARQNLLVV
jgi:hypothetical protein